MINKIYGTADIFLIYYLGMFFLDKRIYKFCLKAHTYSQPSPGHFTHWFIKGFLRVPEGHFDSHTPSEVSTVVCEQIKQWIVPSLGSEKEKDALMLVFKRNGVTLKKIFC